jgi:hypothetical protein
MRLDGSSTLDSYLRVFSRSGKQVARNDEFSGNDSGLSYMAKKAGTYYIGVSGYGNSRYKLSRAGSGRSGSTGVSQLNIRTIARAPRASMVNGPSVGAETALLAYFAHEGQVKPIPRSLLAGR